MARDMMDAAEFGDGEIGPQAKDCGQPLNTTKAQGNKFNPPK